jgi:hypothetical protein
VSCVLIIVVSKLLGYALLYRPEDYYDDECPTDVWLETRQAAMTETGALVPILAGRCC